MALEISVVASALRLQAQQLSARQVGAQDLEERETARQLRNEARIQETRRQQETDREIDRARFSREQVRDTADRQQFDDLRARDAEDQRIEQRIDRRQADLNQEIADQQYAQALYEESEPLSPPLTPTAPSPADDPIAQRDAQPVAQPLDQFIAERNARIAERAAERDAFFAQQSRDLARSEQSVFELRSNPSSLPEQPVRGGVVDFSA